METQTLELELGKKYNFPTEGTYRYVQLTGGVYHFAQNLLRGEIAVLKVPTKALRFNDKQDLIIDYGITSVTGHILCPNAENETDREEFSRLKKILEDKK